MDALVDAILNATSLPNLHPAVVHFPLALLPVALAFETVALGRRRLGENRTLDVVIAVLYVLAALGGGAAWWSGHEAFEAMNLAAATAERVELHEDWATGTAWGLAGLALLRLVLVRWLPVEGGGARRSRRGRLARLAILGLGLAALAAALRTADLGGELVYRLGVGVLAGS